MSAAVRIKRAGVYEITHRDGGFLYVGSSIDLERRFEQWRAALGAEPSLAKGLKPARLNLQFTKAVEAVGRGGWKFAEVWLLPADRDREFLWQVECWCIEDAYDEFGRADWEVGAPGLLNAYYPGSRSPHARRPGYLRRPKKDLHERPGRFHRI